MAAIDEAIGRRPGTKGSGIEAAIANVGRLVSGAEQGGATPVDFASVSRAIEKLQKAEKPKGKPGWAKFAGFVLKPLSVPQAVLAVSVNNVVSLVTGNRDKILSPSAMLGDYSRDEKGRTGWQQVTKKWGLNDWQSFGLGVVADPLWAVGVVAKPAQLAAKAGRVGEGVFPKAVSTMRAPPVPAMPREAAVRAFSEPMRRAARQRQAAMMRAFAPPAATRQSAAVRAFAPAVSPVAKTVTPSIMRATEKLLPTVRAVPTADKARMYREVTRLGRNIERTTFGPIVTNMAETLSGRSAEFAKRRAMGGEELYLKLGFGKSAKELRLPGRLGARPARAFTASQPFAKVPLLRGIARSPLKRAVHQQTVQAGEVAQVALHMIDNIAANFARATGLADGAADKAAQRTFFVAAAENVLPGVAESLKRAFRGEGLWDENYDELLEIFQRNWEDFGEELGMRTGIIAGHPGRYAPQMVTPEIRKAWQEARKTGDMDLSLEQFTAGMGKASPFHERVMGSSYAYMTDDEAVAALTRVGLSDDLAENWVRAFNESAPEAARTAKDPTGLIPELNLFAAAKQRTKVQTDAILDRQIAALAREAGILPDKITKAVAALKVEERGIIAGSGIGNAVQRFTTVFKTILTTVNPSHFVRNATGDMWNAAIEKNLRHAGSGAWHAKNTYWKLAKGDEETLSRAFRVGDQDVTGAELLMESAFLGLGKGYVGSDIGQLLDIFSGGFHDWWGVRHMRNVNVARENAVRMETYTKLRMAGDDPMTAAAKSLRVHFDYSDLTPFEKTVMRNLILFYTWLRRNSMLQVSGIITRPALYNVVRSMEEYRPKLEGEPDYLSKLAMVGIPGLGYANIGLPAEALNRFDLTGENFRQTILGAVNPAIRVPVELGMNQEARSGFPINREGGVPTPHLLAQVLDKLGVDVPEASFRVGGKPEPALPGWMGFLVNQFGGPQAAHAAAAARSRDPGSPQYGPQEWLERFTGVRVHHDDPAAAARRIKNVIDEANFKIRQAEKYRYTP